MRKWFVYLLIFLYFAPTPTLAAEHVIVLHGIARTSSSMAKLAGALEKQVYTVHNINYPSTDHNIAALAEYVHKQTTPLWKNKKDTIHFVSYSMGCIITRAFIEKYKPQNLGRVVMMGPPNQGSEVADFWKNNPLFRSAYGPAGQELTTAINSVPNKLPAVTYPVGVIAGTSTIDPISSVIIPGEDDGKVGVERTRVKGMKDHITIAASHTFIMKNDDAIKQTIHFLKKGKFYRTPAKTTHPSGS